MRRALSSESGFLEFFDLGFGLLRLLLFLLPSLRVQGSGVTEHTKVQVDFELDFLDGFEDGIFKGVEKIKEDFRASINRYPLILLLAKQTQENGFLKGEDNFLTLGLGFLAKRKIRKTQKNKINFKK